MEKQAKKELIATYKERKITGGIFAIKDNRNNKLYLQYGADLKSCRNKFDFSKQIGCSYYPLQKDWDHFGAGAFSFEILEELEKKEAQTPKEFKEDLEALLEMWQEKLSGQELY